MSKKTGEHRRKIMKYNIYIYIYIYIYTHIHIYIYMVVVIRRYLSGIRTNKFLFIRWGRSPTNNIFVRYDSRRIKIFLFVGRRFPMNTIIFIRQGWFSTNSKNFISWGMIPTNKIIVILRRRFSTNKKFSFVGGIPDE